MDCGSRTKEGGLSGISVVVMVMVVLGMSPEAPSSSFPSSVSPDTIPDPLPSVRSEEENKELLQYQVY